jgi:hypothetical protein
MEVERWISLPKIRNVDGEKEYVWDGIEVRTTQQKNKGLYATKDHAPGLMIPYGGIGISQATLDSIYDDSDRSAYIAIAKEDRRGDAVSWLDAHPSLYSTKKNETCLDR